MNGRFYADGNEPTWNFLKKEQFNNENVRLPYIEPEEAFKDDYNGIEF